MLYLALPGIAELWPILVVLLLLFGAKQPPELARAMRSLDRKNLIGAVVTGVQGQRAERGRGDRSRWR